MLTKDEANKIKQTWTDRFGKTIEVDEPDASGKLTIATCSLYDPLSRLAQVDQGNRAPRKYSYDGMSRKLSESLPESGITSYYYTMSGGGFCSGNAGDVCRKTSARGITTTYTYDGENRLNEKQYSDSTGPTIYFF